MIRIRLLREWIARLAAGLRRAQMRDRLDEELRLHRELLAADLAASGSASTPERELGGGSTPIATRTTTA